MSRTFDTTLNIVCVEDFNYVNSFGMSVVFFFIERERREVRGRMRGKEGERVHVEREREMEGEREGEKRRGGVGRACRERESFKGDGEKDREERGKRIM